MAVRGNFVVTNFMSGVREYAGRTSVGCVARPPLSPILPINGTPFIVARSQILQLLESFLELVAESFESLVTLPYELFEQLVSRSFSHSLSRS